MNKFCSNCGKKLNEGADICLNCGVLINNKNSNSNRSNFNNKNDNKKKGLPVWAIILIIFGCVLLIPVVIVIFLALFTYNTVRQVPTDEFNHYIEEFEGNIGDMRDRVDDYASAYRKKDSLNKDGNVGDTLEIDDVKFTLTKVNTYTFIDGNMVKSNDDSEDKYLVLFFDVENNSNINKRINYLNFSGNVDGQSIMALLLLDDIDGVSSLNKSVKPGENMSGYVLFEVDSNWNSFELCYHENITNSEIVFNVVNEKNNGL